VNTFSTSTNHVTSQEARSSVSPGVLASKSEKQSADSFFGNPADIEEETRSKVIKYVSLILTAAFHAVSSSYSSSCFHASILLLITLIDFSMVAADAHRRIRIMVEGLVG